VNSEKDGTKLYEEALAETSRDKPDIELVLDLLEKSLALGNPRAAYALGTWYLHGEHVDKDTSKAMVLLKRAADKNIPEACYDLAVSYEKPVGVAANLKKAFELYVRAALHGDNQSFHEVGRCYYYGIGTPRDENLADIWLEKAEELGVKD
jgi:TPR repeat protein